MNDFRYALRTLRQSSGVAVVAVTSLALGIGAATAIFTVTNAVVLRSLPVAKPNELVLARYVTKKGNVFDGFGFKDYQALRDTPGGLAQLSAVMPWELNLASDEATERVPAEMVSGNYFSMLGVRPRIGRLILAEDDREGVPQAVCVISYGLWQSRFGSSPDVIGRRLRLNGQPFTILGVSPENFQGTSQGTRPQVYLPLMSARLLEPGLFLALQPVGRLRPGVSLQRAEAVLDACFAQLAIAKQSFTFEMSNRHAAPGPRSRLLLADGSQGFDNLKLGFERPLLLLMFLVALLLLIACANVANLLISRASGNRRQIAIRLALGAGRWSLVRQQLAESVLLAVGGATGGLVLSIWMSNLLVRLAPKGSEVSVQPDFTVLAFLVGVACLTVLLFGIMPALESAKGGIEPMLRSASTGGGRRRGVLPGTLVVVQVALSMALLASSGLLVRSLYNIRSIPTGFQSQNIAVASLNPGANQYKTPQARAVIENLIARAETIPGVRAVSAAMVSPISGSLWLYSVDIPGYKAAPGEVPMVYTNAVGPGYFATMGSQLVRGREFTRADREGAPYVVVVNELMAKKYWPGRDPIGQRFNAGALGDHEAEVVGVVRDSIYQKLREDRQPILYVPLFQGDFTSAALQLRFTGDPAPVFNELRTLARNIDRQVPLYKMQTMDAQIGGTLSIERTLAAVSVILGALAIVLAMVGLYSVLANLVAQRAREIGIRMALGAEQLSVIGMVMRDTLKMVLIGVAAGVGIALGASRWIASFLYGIKADDSITYAGIALLVIAAGLMAAFVPSRRASQVDPMVVLRHE